MSDTDSFIEEVSEELKRDQMVKMLRRYGWVVAAVIAAIIGGVAWSEYSKSQERAAAEAVGDGLLAALAADGGDARLRGFENVTAPSAQTQAVVAFLKAGEQAEAGDAAGAAATLQVVVDDADLAMIYRQIAQFKALGVTAETTSVEDRRAGYSDLAQPGARLRLLAEEQIAMIDIETGDIDGAISKLQNIIDDAESTRDLQQRALQVIVALGGEPDLTVLQETQPEN